MKKYINILLLVLIIIVISFYAYSKITANAINNVEEKHYESNSTIVIFETNQGDIAIELYDFMPITTNNFEKLVREGFYDGIIFHRVIPGFMIQGGDPDGTGTGGSSTIEDEFVEGSTNLRGTISMANTGQPHSGSSQFFINLKDNTFLDWNKEPLTSKHPVFGKVIDGMDVVDKIATIKTDARDKPTLEVKIIKAYIYENNVEN